MWLMVLRVLVNVVGAVQSRVMIYKAVVKTVLLYRNESWIVTDAIMKVL